MTDAGPVVGGLDFRLRGCGRPTHGLGPGDRARRTARAGRLPLVDTVWRGRLVAGPPVDKPRTPRLDKGRAYRLDKGRASRIAETDATGKRCRGSVPVRRGLTARRRLRLGPGSTGVRNRRGRQRDGRR